MRNATSSAVDQSQSGTPVYRGPVQPRTSSLDVLDDLSKVNDGRRPSLDKHERMRTLSHDSDHDHTQFAKFSSRRSLAWYQNLELQIVSAITVLALVVRLWAIGYPTSVVFDEVHFGGFASKYIKGGFFMDVHPPLAKMLIALTGWIFGLDPSFDFKEIGMDYIEPKVPYIPMRLMCGLMGVAVIPMAFYTVRNSGHSLHASTLAALLVLFGNHARMRSTCPAEVDYQYALSSFRWKTNPDPYLYCCPTENSIVTQSRLILLDSPLIFFTAFTALAWVNFHAERHDPFSDDWYIWLFATGVGLGLSGSVKWVGLFIIATIGTSTLNQLWTLWGDLRISPRTWLNHFLARAVCLIVVPLSVYMLMFEIHFLLLGTGGDGDGFMSAPFQMTLGHSLKDSPLGVAYGASVSIRHVGTQGGYLHSHASNYETGSKQQQITLYPHKDSNNDWIIQRRDGSIPETLEYLKNGDYVRLMHISTHKRLHSHDLKPPMTEDENHFEVSGYGFEGFAGDANDEWRLEIVDHEASDPEAGEMLHTLRSKFKLVHSQMNCDLFSHKVKLPKWGFEQQEVTCMRSAVVSKATWIIESNRYDHYPEDAPMVNYKKLGFFGKFLELNKVMWTTNAGLTESHPYDSRPSSWPWMRRGISFWGREQKHIYLIGNWFTWYLSSAAVVFYVTMRLLLFVRDKRGYRDDFNGLREYYELSGGFFFMGWCYHYLPFFLMGRQLFLHHYLPALYFAILLFSVTFDLICRFMPNKFRLLLLLLVSSTAIYVFRMRAPLTYGSEWTQSLCEASKVLRTWDYDCNQYPQLLSQYRTSSASTSPSTPIVAEEVKVAESVEHDKGVLADLVSDQGEDSKAAGAAQAQVIRGVEVGEDTGHVQDDSVASGGDGAQVTDQAAAKENEENLSSEEDDSK
ncbi:Protein O-mannosyl-transferase 1 [Mortierella alpina]|nr:Protein O-mannosyl-transferase 1 [Mortierella alpina]